MADPLPGRTDSPQTATGTGPLAVAAVWDVPAGAVRGMVGVPVPARGSVIHSFAVSFGYLLTSGWFSFGHPAGNPDRQIRGTEDSKEVTA